MICSLPSKDLTAIASRVDTGRKHHIIYLSHGGAGFHAQTRFSVLTLLDLLIKQGREDVRIVIFTDRPEESVVHDFVVSIHISPGEIDRFRGVLEDTHRIKLEVLRRAESEIGLPFIYVDSDTRWLKIPDGPFQKLESGGTASTSSQLRPVAYMHWVEYQLSADYFPHYFRLLQRKRNRLAEWSLPTDDAWVMWNAGTLGIPAGAGGMFEKALAITDELLLEAKPRNWVEQAALSLLLTSRFQVESFVEWLAHYHSHGQTLPILLQRFFQTLPPGLSVAQQADHAGRFHIDPAELMKIEQLPANRCRRQLAKAWQSCRKRWLDLRAFRLRRRRLR